LKPPESLKIGTFEKLKEAIERILFM